MPEAACSRGECSSAGVRYVSFTVRREPTTGLLTDLKQSGLLDDMPMCHEVTNEFDVADCVE